MSREKALGIAVGNINPITGEVLADFNSRETKVTRAGTEVCAKEHGQGQMFSQLAMARITAFPRFLVHFEIFAFLILWNRMQLRSVEICVRRL